MRLSEMKEGTRAEISAIRGGAEFQRRITSVGISLGNSIEMMQNDKRNPVMLYVKNTTLALNRKDSELIEVEVRTNAE